MFGLSEHTKDSKQSSLIPLYETILVNQLLFELFLYKTENDLAENSYKVTNNVIQFNMIVC